MWDCECDRAEGFKVPDITLEIVEARCLAAGSAAPTPESMIMQVAISAHI